MKLTVADELQNRTYTLMSWFVKYHGNSKKKCKSLKKNSKTGKSATMKRSIADNCEVNALVSKCNLIINLHGH